MASQNSGELSRHEARTMYGTRKGLLSISLLGLFLVACAQESAPQSGRVTRKTAEPATDQTADQTPGGSTTGGTTTGGNGTRGTDPVDPNAPSNMPIPTGPTTQAINVVTGPVTFDLSTARSQLAGASVTAQLVVNAAAPGVPASITLQGISVTSPASTGFIIYRPVLIAQKAGGEEKSYPIGTDINQRVAKSRSVPLAQPSITISGIEAGQQIKLRFSALEPMANATNTGIPNYRECQQPQNFQAMATALQPCKACHSGLFAYDFMEKDIATACGQHLKLIDATLSPSGMLPNLQRPVSGGHPATTTTGYSQALSTWRTGEGL